MSLDRFWSRADRVWINRHTKTVHFAPESEQCRDCDVDRALIVLLSNGVALSAAERAVLIARLESLIEMRGEASGEGL